MDLSQIGASPYLKVLALGSYIFTNERETDWIASLKRSNRSGGLEELYLDDCPILHKAGQYGHLTIGGYPVPGTAMYGVGQNKNTSIFENSIKWHHVLSGWKNSMRGPKKFVMGGNDWSYEFLTTKTILQQDEYADID
ncbi:hypothetical protein DER44DRAFT_819321 [Fusarium oxysporum]|nr:hypothetical protein DER44DRAFT_819321 [Fusarium oxysporum]